MLHGVEWGCNMDSYSMKVSEVTLCYPVFHSVPLCYTIVLRSYWRKREAKMARSSWNESSRKSGECYLKNWIVIWSRNLGISLCDGFKSLVFVCLFSSRNLELFAGGCRSLACKSVLFLRVRVQNKTISLGNVNQFLTTYAYTAFIPRGFRRIKFLELETLKFLKVALHQIFRMYRGVVKTFVV